MSGAVRSAMQIALLGRAAGAFSRPGVRAISPMPGRQRGEDRVEMLHHIGLAADHHAIAALQPPDAAAGADIDIVDALGRQFLGAADVVDVVGIAAVDQDVARLEMGQQIGDGLVDHGGRHHQPDRPRLGRASWRNPRGDAAPTAFSLASSATAFADMSKTTHSWPPLHETAHHIRTHPAEADHSQLHRLYPSLKFLPAHIAVESRRYRRIRDSARRSDRPPVPA